MKLPKPVTVAIVFATGEEIPGYTVEQMMAWGKANAEAEREECAKVAEQFEPDEKTSYVMYASKAIRARGNT
jgi:hypothetical protein